MDPGHRRKETSPTHTQRLCFVQRCVVPTEYFDHHVTLAYPCFKAEIKRFTQLPLSFQADTKSPAEPLWGHSLVWRTTCQHTEDEPFSETESRISPARQIPFTSLPSKTHWVMHGRNKSSRKHKKSLSSRQLDAVERQCGVVQWRTKPSWGDFPDGSVAKTPHTQCRGPRVNPSSGN